MKLTFHNHSTRAFTVCSVSEASAKLPKSVLIVLVGINAAGVGAQTPTLRIVKATPSGQNVIAKWEDGRAPYQLVCRTNLTRENPPEFMRALRPVTVGRRLRWFPTSCAYAAWTVTGHWKKVGSPTSGYDVTNPAMPSRTCFYRITTDLTAPLTPGGLVVTTNANDSELVLRWNAVTDNSGGAGLKGYNIYSNNRFVRRVLPTAMTTNDSGLTPETLYTYTVSAEDILANEPARRVSISGKTPRRPDNSAPSVPTCLTAIASNCSGINLCWNASTDTGGVGRLDRMATLAAPLRLLTATRFRPWTMRTTLPREARLLARPSGTVSVTVTWYATANTSTRFAADSFPRILVKGKRSVTKVKLHQCRHFCKNSVYGY